jgi:hypothetical protein
VLDDSDEFKDFLWRSRGVGRSRGFGVVGRAVYCVAASSFVLVLDDSDEFKDILWRSRGTGRSRGFGVGRAVYCVAASSFVCACLRRAFARRLVPRTSCYMLGMQHI